MTSRPNDISAEDNDLLARAAAWDECNSLADCSPLRLKELAQKEGIEFATAVLYERVLRNETNRMFFKRVQSIDPLQAVQPTLIGIIPGAFYREHKRSGADGARLVAIGKAMGCPVKLIPVESFGSLSRNAGVISKWLSQNKGQRVLLVSLSKGSADLKVALALPDAEALFENVVAWISMSGLPQGTPLVAWLRRQRMRQLGVRLLLRLRGQRYSVVEELRPEADGPLAVWPVLPPNMRVIHILGFPLRRHLAHPWAPRAYERLASLGPNDGGGFLLADVAHLPGTVLPVWGADHYLQPTWDVEPLLRQVLIEAMAPEPALRQANQSANQPINPPANKSTA